MTPSAPTPAYLPPRSLHPAVATFVGFVLFSGIAGSTWLQLAGGPGLAAAGVVVVLGSVVLLAVRRPRVRPAHVPWAFAVFLIVCALGLIGADDPGSAALGVAAQWADVVGAVAAVLCLTWRELLRILSVVTRLIVVASLVFELIVAVFVRHPVPSPVVDDTWVRGLLFAGGPIQGVAGSAAALGIAALVGLIALALEAAEGTTRTVPAVVWAIVLLATLLLAGAGVSLVAALATAAVFTVASAVRTVTTHRARAWLYALLAAVAAAVVAGVVLTRSSIGQGPAEAATLWTATGQATGPVGVVILAAAVLGGLWRAWFLATDRVFRGIGNSAVSDPAALLPLLIGVALVVRGSLMPVSAFQGGWMLLAVVIVGTALRRDAATSVLTPPRARRSASD